MALMFERLARNFVKNGYFPTDDQTLAGSLSALIPAPKGNMRILDPCAGEGFALSACKQHLGEGQVQAFGIEYEESRAWHAKTLLDRCIHADVQHCLIEKRSFGLLFLNPPYGDLTADQAQTGFVQKGRPRLEKLFYQLTTPSLQFGGVMVMIIPRYSLDAEFCHWIAHAFDRVKIFMAPEQRFKQIVLFGIRKRSTELKNIAVTKQKLLNVSETEPEVLPVEWNEVRYEVPSMVSAEVKFSKICVDSKQLAEEIQHQPCLWNHFTQHFENHWQKPRRPLMALSDWHLALSLAAGQVSGIVQSQDHRTFIIKGDTHKEVMVKTTCETTDDDKYVEVRTHVDKFVPVIRAIDMTPQSLTFGQVLTIR